ncbi:MULTISPECIES: antibiotic biosynthesis monooxygenase [Nostoc]|uniref:Antibiotic biosynthesis monooxygenase n=1 Tax=Nostoc paludosum FACHB-159 TaxID=2692908 RepID=A0ABR8KIY2_9NOSO|nr:MULTISPECIES: antibiotic biosynthesis monooxygenase [Nostoc]MBD2683183.1 antibiotic biosynthesis monooxygenase [Nostoc sp. FACHB-857]MBD2739528.1 antibiotic biosynthesis monooxygenase [Nostoc paludosum FACHB-159]
MAKVYYPATIEVNHGIATFINVFTVEPANQQVLLDLLRSQTDSLMRKQPGFLNANFHRSFDGIKVVNYVQWKDQQSSEVIHENSDIMTAFSQYQALNVKMDLRYYEVVSSFGQPTVIKPQNGLKTLISLVHVQPNQQQQVLESLETKVYPMLTEQIGFISMNLHRSLDGNRILNYSQWNSQPPHEILELLQQRETLMNIPGTTETHLYEVAFTADAHGLST